MAKIISLINQKGGVGKTTSSINIAKSLVELKYKVLLIDADPQCDLSSGIGIFDEYFSIKNMIENIEDIEIEKLKVEEDLYLIKGYSELSEIKLNKNSIKNPIDLFLKEQFDFIIIDCAPQVIVKNSLTINGCVLLASDYVLMPVDVNFNSVKGTLDFVKKISQLKESKHSDLKILGFFFTNVNKQVKMFSDYSTYINDVNSNLLFKTFIRADVNVKKAQEGGVTLNFFKKNSNAAIDYINLVDELILKL